MKPVILLKIAVLGLAAWAQYWLMRKWTMQENFEDSLLLFLNAILLLFVVSWPIYSLLKTRSLTQAFKAKVFLAGIYGFELLTFILLIKEI